MRRPRRSSPRARAIMLLLALACAAGAVYGFAVGPAGAQKGTSVNPLPAPPVTDQAQVGRGRQLFLDGCSSCHGNDARGKQGLAPTLVGAGSAAADFYLTTGRMPLSSPTDQPTRAQPAYNRQDIQALDAYVGSLGAGPTIPTVDVAKGNITKGLASFTLHCAGCHQVGGAGGIVTGAIAPPLNSRDITPRQVAEAIRVGPYLMPNFNAQQVSDQDIADIARYVRSTAHPDDLGGWGIGHIGPIPEGMIAWFLAIVSLLLVARVIGEREPQ